MVERMILFGLVRSGVSDKDNKPYYVIEYMTADTGKTHNDLISKDTYDSIESQNIPPATTVIANMEVFESNYARITSLTVN